MSDETEKEIEAFIKQFGVKYPILLSKGGGNKYGIEGYPTGYLLDPDLKIVREGAGWGQGDADEILKNVRLWPEGLPATPAFKALKASWDGRRYAELSASVDKLLAQSADADKQGAEKVKKLLDDRVAATTAEIDELAKGPDFLEAQGRLEEIAKTFEKMPPSDKAKGTLETFKKTENVQKEIAAMKKLVAYEKQLDAAKKVAEKRKLLPGLRQLEKDLKGTYAAERARKLVEDVGMQTR